jgi:hypothetical protein
MQGPTWFDVQSTNGPNLAATIEKLEMLPLKIP